jgi:uncharacterized membrane protein
MGTNRLESFSDGVIAVAITLLVLDVGVPGVRRGHSLIGQLLANWPHYAAYAISFVTIGIIWINHHVMIGRLREADHPILILNLLLLMSIGLLPFATALMAAYLRHPGAGRAVAAAVYSGAFLLMSVMFLTLNRHILLRKPHMHRVPLSAAHARGILARSGSGLIPYVIATPLAFVSPYATLIICGAVAVFYALPVASGAGVGGGTGDRPKAVSPGG